MFLVFFVFYKKPPSQETEIIVNLNVKMMKTKLEIVKDWLPRYTGMPLEHFGEYILLTNFDQYIDLFCEWHNVKVADRDKPMIAATADDITIINFGMGSANAATIMD